MSHLSSPGILLCSEGGSIAHALYRCGPNVGLFINLRKCVILYLHSGQGSWHAAPYLDKHGEVDVGLRYVISEVKCKNTSDLQGNQQTQPPAPSESASLRRTSQERVAATRHSVHHLKTSRGRQQHGRMGNAMKQS